MSLTPGTKLGPYEVAAPLGAGGMGEVYRARDTRLDRTVAIKILPAHFSSDPVRKQRFEREARAISGLNHPNICTLHDVGSQNGIDYLVMEFIEGESLAQRLEKGPLPLEQALKVGREIADALDKAHRSGLIHRDLKPGNIMLTKSGAKLLDFGLARPTSQAASLATLSATASRQSPATEDGAIVGTFQYMSPEQVEGKELDARSDIFSLGAVLYEMLTGQRAFEGKSQLSAASAILNKEPTPISTLKPLAPLSLEHVVRRCLAKDPDDRWQTARDVALELNSITQSEPAAETVAGLARARQRNFREWLGWSLTGILLLTGVYFFFRPHNRDEQSQQLLRASILAPDGSRIPWASDAAISPDGRLLVFSASTPDGKQPLWFRPVNSLSARPLPGTDGGYNPFWSPDSRWIGFISFSDAKLKKISVEGGTPFDICPVSVGRGGAWGPDGRLLFVPGSRLPIYSVPAAGGSPVPVTQLDKSLQEVVHRWPVFLPDGKHFLFFVGEPQNATYTGSLGTTERKLILKNDSNAIYAEPGYLLFVRNGFLMAQPFDSKRLELAGSAVAIAEDVPTDGLTQRGLFSASANGVLSIQPKVGTLLQPVWRDRSGKFLEALGEPAMYFPFNMALSPDEQKVALVIIDPQTNIRNTWIFDVQGHRKTRLTEGSSPTVLPVWSPNGNQILFTSLGQGLGRVFSVPATGIGQPELFFASEGSDYAQSWSSDGRYIALLRNPVGDAKNRSLWILPTFGDKKPYRLFESSHLGTGFKFSPDVRWLTYQSNETGRDEIYIVPFPDANRKIPVSAGGGSSPRWSPDGKELYYLSGDGTLMSATLQAAGSGLQVTRTVPLFKTDSKTFTVSHDGKRFLVYDVSGNQPPSAITLIVNWTKALPK